MTFRRNAFMARPPRAYYHGTARYPGFHTTKQMDKAAAYALGALDLSRAVKTTTRGVNYVVNYPVVVAVDMTGLTALPDYDAFVFVATPLVDMLREGFLRTAVTPREVERMTDEDLACAVADYIDGDMGDESRAMPDTALDALVEAYANYESVAYNFRDLSPEAIGRTVRAVAAGGDPPDDVLRDVTDQYRYDEDVSPARLRAVWYVQPFAESIFDYENEDEDGDEDGGTEARYAREWPGFTIMSIDQIDDPTIEYHLVHESKSSRDESMRIEYHGTLLSNLRAAAPRMKLPRPPSPPFRRA